MCAAQAIGAVPVPLYADSVADEMAYVLEHAEVTVAIAENQEQVDKIMSIADRVPKLTHIVYDEPRGLLDYDHSRLTWINEVIKAGHEKLKDPAERRALRKAWSRRARAAISRSCSTPRAPPAGPRA